EGARQGERVRRRGEQRSRQTQRRLGDRADDRDVLVEVLEQVPDVVQRGAQHAQAGQGRECRLRASDGRLGDVHHERHDARARDARELRPGGQGLGLGLKLDLLAVIVVDELVEFFADVPQRLLVNVEVDLLRGQVREALVNLLADSLPALPVVVELDQHRLAVDLFLKTIQLALKGVQVSVYLKIDRGSLANDLAEAVGGCLPALHVVIHLERYAGRVKPLGQSAPQIPELILVEVGLDGNLAHLSDASVNLRNGLLDGVVRGGVDAEPDLAIGARPQHLLDPLRGSIKVALIQPRAELNLPPRLLGGGVHLVQDTVDLASELTLVKLRANLDLEALLQGIELPPEILAEVGRVRDDLDRDLADSDLSRQSDTSFRMRRYRRMIAALVPPF